MNRVTRVCPKCGFAVMWPMSRFGASYACGKCSHIVYDKPQLYRVDDTLAYMFLSGADGNEQLWELTEDGKKQVLEDEHYPSAEHIRALLHDTFEIEYNDLPQKLREAG